MNVLDGLPDAEAMELSREGICNIHPPERHEAPTEEAPKPETPQATYMKPSQFLYYHRQTGNLPLLTRGDN